MASIDQSGDVFRAKNQDIDINKQTIKFGDTSSPDVSMSIFNKKIKIGKNSNNILAKYDKDANGVIDEGEMSSLKESLIEYAGSDHVLDKQELMKMLGKNVNSNDAEKIYKEFLNMVNVIKDSSAYVGTKVNNKTIQIEKNINSDGSGTKVIKGKDSHGLPYKYTYTYAKGSILMKTEESSLAVKNTCEYQYNEEGKLSKIVRNTIGMDGEQIGKGETNYKYNNDGTINSKEINSETKSNGKIIKSTAESTYEYTNGKMSKLIEKSNNPTKGNSTTVTQYETDGTTIKNQEKEYYKQGTFHKESYNGNNLENRIGGHLPTTSIVYESDGTTIKEITKNQFDKDGILIGDEVYDKSGKLIKKHDFSQVDGKFDTAYQKSVGDCYLMATIDSLANNEAGQKILKNLITTSKDDKGETTYTITFPGAKIARDSLINGTGDIKMNKMPADKVFIQESYTITEAELKEAAKKAGKNYSAGDKDVLILEIAYEKYRKDVAKTLKANNIEKPNARIAGLWGGSSPDGTLNSGLGSEVTFVLTGRQTDEFIRPKNDKPSLCYIDSDMQIHVTDSSNNLTKSKAMAAAVSNSRKDNLDSLLDKLRIDSKDGKIDDYAATIGLMVSVQEVDGKAIVGGGHEFAITKVTDTTVELANPWDPEKPIVMSIEDFKKAVTTLQCLKVSGHSEHINPTNPTLPHPTLPHMTQPHMTLPHMTLPHMTQPHMTLPHMTLPHMTKPSITMPHMTLPSGITHPTPDPTGKTPNFTVRKGQGYTAIIKQALIDQGIEPTKENIRKAKAQFKASNPEGTVHVYMGQNRNLRGHLFLVPGKVYIPKFDMNLVSAQINTDEADADTDDES